MVRKRGFTLIELLVVVSIIAVLIVVLVPAVGKAKANAVRVKCAAVLRAWSLVIHEYAQENDDYFGINSGGAPWATLSSGATTMYDTEWNGDKIAGNKLGINFRTCPGDPTYGLYTNAGAAGGKVIGNGNVGARPQIDYTMVRYIPTVQYVETWKLNEFNHPGTTLLIADGPSNGKDYSITSMNELDTTTPAPVPITTNPFWQGLQRRHQGIGNVMFLDGHAEQFDYPGYQQHIQPGTGPNDYSRPWTFIKIP